MAIATYTQLTTSIEDWLERADLTTRVPDFVALAEAKFNRELFVPLMEGRSVTSVDIASTDPEFISLPVDFQSMRRIRLKSVTGKPCLEFKSGTQMDEYRYGVSNVSGHPRYFTIMGSEIELLPTPDANYVLEMVYRKTIPPLASNTNNWLLVAYPDVYLYGSLVEAAPFLSDDPRLPIWMASFQAAINSLNRLAITSAFNAGPMRITVSGNTP
jgi:hypothetical protein